MFETSSSPRTILKLYSIPHKGHEKSNSFIKELFLFKIVFLPLFKGLFSNVGVDWYLFILFIKYQFDICGTVDIGCELFTNITEEVRSKRAFFAI